MTKGIFCLAVISVAACSMWCGSCIPIDQCRLQIPYVIRYTSCWSDSEWLFGYSEWPMPIKDYRSQSGKSVNMDNDRIRMYTFLLDHDPPSNHQFVQCVWFAGQPTRWRQDQITGGSKLLWSPIPSCLARDDEEIGAGSTLDVNNSVPWNGSFITHLVLQYWWY